MKFCDLMIAKNTRFISLFIVKTLNIETLNNEPLREPYLCSVSFNNFLKTRINMLIGTENT